MMRGQIKLNQSKMFKFTFLYMMNKEKLFIPVLIDRLISSFLSYSHEKAAEALCVRRIQTRLAQNHEKKFFFFDRFVRLQ